MYTDPWDLKHQIQQIQQEQRHNKTLLSRQQKSSTTYSDKLIQDLGSNSDFYQVKQHYQSDQNNSDQNTFKKPQLQSYGKSLQSSYQQSHEVQFVEKPRLSRPRKKYGNLIVFWEAKSFILNIGPNYLFFFFAYLCFTVASIYLICIVNSSLDSIPFKIFNFCFCTLQNLSYLAVALSNPGVKLPQKDIMMPSQKDQNHYCKKCAALQQRKTQHCRQCDICVQDYDHHCPWTSKCIGGGNLKRFYLFVCLTPFYIFYYVVAFMICMATLAVPHAKNLKPHGPATF